MKPSNLYPVIYLTLGWFGLQMAMALDVAQFPVMLESKLSGISLPEGLWPWSDKPLEIGTATLVGAILALGPLAGITIQPLVGRYGDEWARQGFSRRKLIAVGVAIGILCTVLLSAPLELLPLIGLIAVFFISYNIVIVCYRAFVTATSSRRALTKEKGSISGFIALFSGLGSFFMFVLCGFLSGTVWPFWLGGLSVLITFGLFFKYSPIPKAAGTDNRSEAETGQEKLFTPVHILFYALPICGLLKPVEDTLVRQTYQKPIFRLFLVIFFAWMGINALRIYFVLYADHVLHLPAETANILLAVLTLVMVLSAIPLGQLGDRMDNAKLFRICLCSFSVICIGAYFIVHEIITAVILSMLLGACFAGMVVCPLTSLFRHCPKSVEGSYAGLYNLFISIPQLYSLLITGWLIDTVGDYRVIMLVGFATVFLGFLASFRMAPERAT